MTSRTLLHYWIQLSYEICPLLSTLFCYLHSTAARCYIIIHTEEALPESVSLIHLTQVYKDINGVVYAATLGHVDIAKGDGMKLKFIGNKIVGHV